MSKITRKRAEMWKDEAYITGGVGVLCELIDALVEDEPKECEHTDVDVTGLCHDCGRTLNSYKQKPEPAEIEWKAGDWAWHGRMDKLWQISPHDLVYDVSTHTIPTRDQLAVEIGDSGVKAWAWESNSEFISLATSNEIEDGMYDRIIIEALNIPIVSADQVTRHFGGNYSPEATE